MEEGEHDTEGLKRIVNERIASNDQDTGKVCGSIAWIFYSSGDQVNVKKYALNGSAPGDQQK